MLANLRNSDDLCCELLSCFRADSRSSVVKQNLALLFLLASHISVINREDELLTVLLYRETSFAARVAGKLMNCFYTQLESNASVFRDVTWT